MKNLFTNASADFRASIVVSLVALPLCIGIASGSDAPIFSGIIAGIVGGIVIGLLSGSHLSVSGPAAGLTTIVAAAIFQMPSYEAFLVTVVLAGIIQVILGFLKVGVVGDYVPSGVIKGMLTAIGIILILKQIPHLLGYDIDFEGDYDFIQKDSTNTFSEIFYAAQKINPLALIIGCSCLLLHALWNKVLAKKGKFFKTVPAPLVVVVAGVLMHEFAKIQGYELQEMHMVNLPVPKTASAFFSFFTTPDWHSFEPSFLLTAATIAIVASLETLLNIEAADNIDPYHRVTPPNRELKAQGIGNIVSGMLGGLPVTSVVVRTSANINAGGTTKLSAILHGIYLLIGVTLIPFILKLIPLSALAAILIYTGYKLVKPSVFKSFYRKGTDQFVPFVTTVVAIIFFGLLVGILIGIVVGLFFVLRSNFKTALFVINDDNKYLFRLRKDVSFLNKPILKAKLEKVPENSSVLIDLSKADFVDKDVIEVINEFLQHAHLKNIKVDIKKSLTKKDHQFVEEQVVLVQ